ncbi:MAG: hypothetical protein ACREVI_02440 [Steroidobacteraceae bacterium]
MSFTYYDAFYYGTLVPLFTVYFLSFKRHQAGGISSFFFFRNAAVVYFGVFSILLGKFVYEGTLLASAAFNEHMYFLMLYYGTVLLGMATMFNFAPARDMQLARSRINIIPFLLALAVKAALFGIDSTPMQELILKGFAAAHIKQLEWHQPGAKGIVHWFYVYLSPVMSVLFIFYFRLTKNWIFRLLLLILIFETSGFFFSKSGLIVPLVVLLVLSRIRLRYLFACVLAGVIAVFYVRVGTAALFSEELLAVISERFVLETGYANPQLDLYKAEHPPLGYESRYYLGFNMLFGIEPAVDASRQAYLDETGRFGATSSGHAAVSLYAFWGPAFYLILPALIAFVLYVDRQIVSRLASYYALVAYLFVSFKAINYLTVDIQRLVSFQTVVELTFLSSVVLMWLLGRALRTKLFGAPIVLSGYRGGMASQARGN